MNAEEEERMDGWDRQDAAGKKEEGRRAHAEHQRTRERQEKKGR